MQQDRQKIGVKIFGDPYTVLGDGDLDKIVRLADFVDKKMNLIYQHNPRLSPTKVAVLTALNLAEEYTKLKEEHQALLKLLDKNKD